MLIDATAFYLRDANGIPETLAQEKQGSFSLDSPRPALYMDRTRNFPKNTEVEATLTFTTHDAGPWVRSVAPAADFLAAAPPDGPPI